MLTRKPGPKTKLAIRAAWSIALARRPSCGRLIEVCQLAPVTWIPFSFTTTAGIRGWLAGH
jgi:hypothetical protein